MMKDLTMDMTDGFLVHTFILQPDGEPKGHIHLLHGMAEHIGRYEEFAHYLAGQGYIVSGHDHRGHGKTAELNGKQGHFADTDGFERVVQDVYEIVTALRVQYPAKRFILFGHSMGSFVARRYIQLHGQEVDLAVLSGTGGDPGVSRLAGQAVAYLQGKKNGFDQPDHFLNKLLFGGFNKAVQNPKTPFDWLASNPEAVAKYLADPACGFVSTTRLFADLFEGLGKVHAADEISNIPQTLPILLFSGIEDPVGNYGKGVWDAAQHYDRAGIKDVTVMLFEGCRHEMLNENNRQHVFDSIYNWMEKR
ncbi:alpha/beta hydrolase [Sporosarcina sp. YIM B06819]|uniref:alpha/beta hydrolase n=1 Tax=Sporosarcina sp. YIM B06819 TaxID=3081769 RepID=UPI00298BFB2A|nr:alpha/beta hydrolase [Sporosarcina sp. YIM B06819]